MSETLNISKPVRVKSWQDLYSATQCLRSDLEAHSYRGWRSSRRRYCACVKVGNAFADIDKAIAAIDVEDPEIELMLRENFDPNRIDAEFQDWLDHSAEYLQEWFSGTTHAADDYFIDLLDVIENGGELSHSELRALPTKRSRKELVNRWLTDNRLFREALNTVDTRSLTWEGRSGGYITWDNDRDLGRAALCVKECAREAIKGNNPSMTFSEALKEFREIEREHNLNMALLHHVEAWAKSMSFQDELNYLVRNYFDELGCVPGEKMPPLQKYADLVVTIEDSLAAGNCESGTMQWVAQHLPGRRSATIGELLSFDDMKATLTRLCRFVVRRKVMEQTA